MVDQGVPSNDRNVQQRRQGLQRIENNGARQVTFSKRKKGLFRKASELATLCGAEVGILVNSPAGRPYTFGSPAVEAVFNRFLSNHTDQPNRGLPNPYVIVNNLNQQFMDLSSQLHAADFRSTLLNDRLKRAANAAPECNWSEKIEELEVDQLHTLFDTLCQTKERLVARQMQISQEGGSSSHADVSIIGNYPGNSSLVEGSQVSCYNESQTTQTNARSTEQRMSCSLPPNLNTSPIGSADVSLNQNFVLVSGGANNASRQPLQGLSFGPFGYDMGNLLNTVPAYYSNNELSFNPNGFVQSQIYGIGNSQMPHNFYSSTFHPNNLMEGTNYGPPHAEPGTLASIPGPYISTPHGQFHWENVYLGQTFVGGLGFGAQDQAGPSNLGTNNSMLGSNETNNVGNNEADPEATSFRHL